VITNFGGGAGSSAFFSGSGGGLLGGLFGGGSASSNAALISSAGGLADTSAAGGLTGLAIAMISRGSDVKLEPGTSIEMIIQREVTVDANRVTSRREVIVRD